MQYRPIEEESGKDHQQRMLCSNSLCSLLNGICPFPNMFSLALLSSFDHSVDEMKNQVMG